MAGSELPTNGSPKGKSSGKTSITGKSTADHGVSSRYPFNYHNILFRRQREEFINSFPNSIATIQDDDGESFRIHFAALFSHKQDAIPLLLLHGWPG
ncbi:unnamed protein product [Clonostachys rhizophaga]|uniref:Epoxide hydrolase N-terminal domain-containing protein n=1 Tax=Clonostachys rhizophaga TaxID=160324 RepID=A0A9N9YL12_9HYPO|nr:unnamed protein product [Clonostachys rhizophaga]